GTKENSLKIFGFYAATGFFWDEQYGLSDFDPPHRVEVPAFGVVGPILGYSYPDKNYSNLQAGSVLSLSAQRLSLSYNFERRDYYSLVILPPPIGAGTNYVYVLPNTLANAHRVFVQWKAIDKSNVCWYTGLHASSIKNHLDIDMQYAYSHNMDGDVNGESRSWTGGWNNRLELKNFSFGADIAYHLGKTYHSTPGTTTTQNLFAIPSLYAGYKTTLKNDHPLEIYLSVRNAEMNDSYADYNGNRQYFGAGFNLKF
ncbi:MAG: hypothetical protein ACJ749_15715, partial [Flavisolibacter sp.]